LSITPRLAEKANIQGSLKTVTAAVLRQGEAILLARRKPGQKQAGYWEFPGGKVEEGETLQACLEREIGEELGIAIRAGEVLATSDYCYEHGAIHLVALAAEMVSGNLLLTVHDQLAWVDAADLLRYQLAPADIPIARALMGLESSRQGQGSL